MQISVLQFIRGQLATVPPVTTQDLTGKTVVVVGANIGIGYEATKHFANMNPGRLVLACRNPARGEEAVERISRETECKTAELRLVDLTTFASVNAFVEKFNAEVDRLDILVLNAAIMAQADYPTTKDGWEMSFQTNHLSPSLLAILLLPKMIETAKKHETTPRLVVVSSDTHYLAQFQQKMLESPHPLRVFSSTDYFNPAEMTVMSNLTRYLDTKLLNVFFTRALASRTSSSSPVIINTVNPGLCYSNLRQYNSIISQITNYLIEKALARTTEEGSRQLVWAALGSEGADERALHGAFITDMRVQEAADSVVGVGGKELEDKLWVDLVEELEQVNPQVRVIAQQYLS
ncbi:NAD(P)-binding protein [Crepidotus variabilis]|uniref:NAD(P)-binding protein n=1 Tax=Crepidotus variabilis TaxID=179855 RepID=A0A9P6EBK7_9AGAR|nr:NAD(P)-binding protein [Crepidotus variabilis]